jgi:hypothetical protein
MGRRSIRSKAMTAAERQRRRRERLRPFDLSEERYSVIARANEQGRLPELWDQCISQANAALSVLYCIVDEQSPDRSSQPRKLSKAVELAFRKLAGLRR